MSTGTWDTPEIPNYYHLAFVSGDANYNDVAGLYHHRVVTRTLGWENTWANNSPCVSVSSITHQLSASRLLQAYLRSVMRVPESLHCYRSATVGRVGVMSNKGIKS